MSKNGRENTNTRAAAERYLRSGLAVIPVPAGEKNPNRTGWQNERHTVETIDRCWTNGQGVGVLWGEPSGGLVDVDLDWSEARDAAQHILPATRTFGRPSAPESHRVYRAVNTIPKTRRYKIGGDGTDRSVVEVLSTGTQSLVPPSLHDSGERREWHQDRSAANLDGAALTEGVEDVATAALIARNWPGKGARKDYVMAAAGYVGRRLPRERAERVMDAAISASGDEENPSRHRDVRDTLDKLEADRPTTGGTALDALAPGVADLLRGWHGWGVSRQGPEANGHGRYPVQRLTDLGNAERLVARHGEDLRYVHPWGKWLLWDGKRWKPDASGEVERRAVETVASIYAEAAHAADKDERKALARHAERSESRSRIDAMIALARSRPGVPVMPEELDADPWLLNARNGTIDLRTGELRPHDRGDLTTKIAPVEYDPDAQAPRFARFLREVFGGDEELIAFVRRFAGYSLTGSVEERVFAILHGFGKNGKSTLVELVQDVLGSYATTADTETVLAKRHQGVGNDVAALKGARFVSAAEVEQDRRLAESKVKSLTGNDTVTARFLYSEPFTFKPEFKLWLSTNNKPVIRGTDDAIWDRIRLIPFEQRFVGDRRDPKLPEKLREESSGVLAWMVRGCAEWRREGLGEPERVRAATEVYRAEQDTLAAFIEECCTVHPSAWCKFSDLYAAYDRWCAESNETAEKKKALAMRLTERGFVADKGTNNAAIRRGLALRHDGGPDPPRITDPVPDPVPDPAPPSPDGGGTDNPITDGRGIGNSQNACKSGVSGEPVTDHYPKSTNSELNPLRVESFSKNGNDRSFGNSGPVSGVLTPREGHPTAEQEARIRDLKIRGWGEWSARTEVLAADHSVGCECEVCG